MNHISLFSGIGGFELAAEWAGWNNIASCEINPFGRKVLQYYWPNAYHHDDIHTLTKEILDEKTDWKSDELILTGGFPCQPYSVAGKRLGKEDERHLWPQMLRIIRELKPRWIVGENVLGLVNWSGGLVFEEVQVDLEAEGYEVQPFVLPAASVGAPHRRDRVWFVAHANNSGSEKSIVQHSDLFAGSVGNNKQTTVDPDNKGRSTGPGQIQSENGEVPKRHNNAELGNSSDGVVANAKGNGNRRELRGLETENAKFGKPKKCWKDNLQFRYDGRVGNAANACNKGLQRSAEQGGIRYVREESHKQPAGYVRPNWEKFPTQSPVCNGDDGLSTRLDGITFSKWRNESIKAGGNAIVPQVVYQIFKAINFFNNQKI